MEIINKNESRIIRNKYIDCFINQNQYYKDNILKLKKYSDGMCYFGYLWDCFKQNVIILNYEHFISKKEVIMVFWDIHSCEKIFIKDYWKYPKDSVIKLTVNEFINLKTSFPEDIYLFDETYTWTIALTHENIMVYDDCCEKIKELKYAKMQHIDLK